MNYYNSKELLEKRLHSVIKFARQKLKDSGLNDAEIDSAVHGRMDAIEVATEDDSPTLQFLFVSLVMRCRDAKRLIKNDEIEKAEGYVLAAETDRRVLSDRPIAAKQIQTTDAQREAADHTNQPYKIAKNKARKVAQELVASDEEQTMTKKKVIDQITEELIRSRLYAPNDRVLWNDWLKEEPAIIPEYMTKPGRRK